MSIAVARRKRLSLYYCIAGLVLMSAAVMAISARDSSGVGLRAGMVMLTAGAAFLLPWQYSLPAAIAINAAASIPPFAQARANAAPPNRIHLPPPSRKPLSAFNH